MTTLLSTTYFGPVQWYQKLNRATGRVLIERHETFQKQTYRNRCLIATPQGVQALTVPVEHSALTTSLRSPVSIPKSEVSSLKSIRLSDHGNWRHQHWQAITSAYGDTPFFEYYEDDLRPFFAERRWEFLLDFNEDIRQKMCELLDIHPNVEYTDVFVAKRPTNNLQYLDYRDSIRPKHPVTDPDFQPRPYYQVFGMATGFLPNLSILDLLLNMGPESIYYI